MAKVQPIEAHYIHCYKMPPSRPTLVQVHKPFWLIAPLGVIFWENEIKETLIILKFPTVSAVSDLL
jgi:hypothetical protein